MGRLRSGAGGPGDAGPPTADAAARPPRRRPGRRRRWLLRPAMWGLVALVAAVSVAELWVDSERVRAEVKSQVRERLAARLGRGVEIRAVDVDLVPFSIEVWELEVAGLPGDDEPFLVVPWAEVDASPTALREGQIRIDRVRVERPRISLQLYGDGEHNLPRWRTRSEGERLDLYLDHVEVAAAEVTIDHHTIELSLAAESVAAGLDGQGELHLVGRALADDVTVRLPGARAMAVDAAAQLEVRRGSLRVVAGEAKTDHARADVRGECVWEPGSATTRSDDDRPARDTKCSFATRGRAAGAQLAALGWLDELVGDVDFDGELAWRPGAVGWRGEVHATAASFFDRRLEDVHGTLAADRWNVRLDLDRARYAGGTVDGTVTWEHREAGRPVVADLRFAGLAADRLLADQGVPVAGVASRLAGTVTYRFSPGAAERGDGAGRVTVVADPRRDGLALAGSAALAIAGGVVTSDAIRLAEPTQSVLAHGWYDLARDRGRFDYQVATADVSRLLDLAQVDLAARDAAWWPTAGAGEATGTLHLTPGRPWTELDFDLAAVANAASLVDRTSGHLEIDRAGARDLRLDVTGADGVGALVVGGAIGFGDAAPSELTVQAFDWPMDAVHPFLPFALPLDGRISGRLDLELEDDTSRGTVRAQVSPARLAAREPAVAGAEMPRLAWPERFPTDLDALGGDLAWAAGEVTIERLVAASPAGELTVTGRAVPATGEVDLEVRTAALDPSRPPFADLVPGAEVAGPVRLTGRVHGQIGSPEVELEASAAGRDGAAPSRLALRVTGGRIDVEGRLLGGLDLAGGGRLAPGEEVVVALASEELGALARRLTGADAELDGRVAGALHLSLSPAGALDAALVLDRLTVDVAGRRLVARQPVRLRLTEDAVRVESLRLEEPTSGSFVHLAGRVGRGGEAPLDLAVDGRVAVAWLGELLPPFGDGDHELEGTLRLAAALRGPLRAPYLEGDASLDEGRLRLAGFPHSLDGVEGALQLTREALLLERLEGSLAGGRVRIDGRVELPAGGVLAIGDELAYRLQLRGDDLGLRYPEGWTMQGATELTLRSRPGGAQPGGAQLTGRADLARLAYLADVAVDLEELLAGVVRRRRLEIEPAGGAADAIELDVEVAAPGTLRVENNVADLTGSAELVVRGTLARPVVFGTVELLPGGALVYGGTEYRVERGQLRFADPQRLDPELDLVATAEVRDVDVTLDLSGRFDRLEARFASQPPLPEAEVFRLLAAGDGLGDPVPFEGRRVVEVGEPAATSAASFLYGQAASAIGDRMGDLFGFDKFRIDPLTGSGDNLSTARITVGKRLSKDVFVTYSVDPSSTEGQRLRLEWQLDDDLALVLDQNGDDSYSADARWETTFD